MRERLRDKYRDDLASDLTALGVKAVMAERGRIEEKVENSWYQRSLGVIDILEGPIRWINTLKKDQSKHSPPQWWTVLGIPDAKPIPNNELVKIRTIRKKTFPVFGRVVDVSWRGTDWGTGLVNTLSQDQGVRTMAKQVGGVEVRGHTEKLQGWTVTIHNLGVRSGWIHTRKPTKLTESNWDALQRLADLLLVSPRAI